MRLVIRALSVLCILIGAVWTLQGANVIGGSRMTGDPFWLWVGALLLVAGLALSYAGFRRRGRRT